MISSWSFVFRRKTLKGVLGRFKEILRTPPGRRHDNVLKKKIVATSISDRSKTFLRRLCDVFVPAGIKLFSLTYFRTTGCFDLFKVCIRFPYFLSQFWLGYGQSSNNCRILRGSAYQREVRIVNSATAAHIRGSAYWRKYRN